MSLFETESIWSDRSYEQKSYVNSLALKVIAEQGYDNSIAGSMPHIAEHPNGGVFGGVNLGWHESYRYDMNASSAGVTVYAVQLATRQGRSKKPVKCVVVLSDDRVAHRDLSLENMLSRITEHIAERAFRRAAQKQLTGLTNRLPSVPRHIADEHAVLPFSHTPDTNNLKSKSISHAWLDEFVPSDSLISFVERGIAAYVEERPSLKDAAMLTEFLSLQNMQARKTVFSRRLRALISTVAFRQADGLEQKIPVTRKSQFTSVFLSGLEEVFPFWPTELLEFQKILRTELINYLEAGRSYSGYWGKLIVRYGEIEFELNRDSVAKLDGDWKQAPKLDL